MSTCFEIVDQTHPLLDVQFFEDINAELRIGDATINQHGYFFVVGRGIYGIRPAVSISFVLNRTMIGEGDEHAIVPRADALILETGGVVHGRTAFTFEIISALTISDPTGRMGA